MLGYILLPGRGLHRITPKGLARPVLWLPGIAARHFAGIALLTLRAVAYDRSCDRAHFFAALIRQRASLHVPSCGLALMPRVRIGMFRFVFLVALIAGALCLPGRADERFAQRTDTKADTPQPAEQVLTDAAIAALVLQASRAAYPGSCPCPYDVDRAGKRCGGRSAYNRPNGREPFCYIHDITSEMIAIFRRHNSRGGSAVPPMLLDRGRFARPAR